MEITADAENLLHQISQSSFSEFIQMLAIKAYEEKSQKTSPTQLYSAAITELKF